MNKKITRHYFSRKFKRKALLEYSKGRKPVEILQEFGICITNDKKYAVKLFYKWKKELYKNLNLLSVNYVNIDKNYSQNEINSIGNDNEKDDIFDELSTKMQSYSTFMLI